MLRDRKSIWIIEYTLGLLLIILPFLGLILSGEKLPDAHLWTVELFTISLGVILISCASSMRQRLKLQMRIEQLAQGK